MDLNQASTAIGCLLGVCTLSKLGFLDFEDLTAPSNSSITSEYLQSLNYAPNFTLAETTSIFLKTSLERHTDLLLPEKLESTTNLRRVCFEPEHRRNVQKSVLFTDMQNFIPHKDLLNDDCNYIMFYGDKLWSKKSRDKLEKVIYASQTLPFTKFAFVYVNSKLVTNISESTLLVNFGVHSVPRLVLASGNVHVNCSCRPIFSGKTTKSGRKNGPRRNFTSTTVRRNKVERLDTPFRSSASHQIHIQMHGLSADELSQKLAILVGEYQNRYWYPHIRRVYPEDSLIQNATFSKLQHILFNDKVLLSAACAYTIMYFSTMLL